MNITRSFALMSCLALLAPSAFAARTKTHSAKKPSTKPSTTIIIIALPGHTHGHSHSSHRPVHQTPAPQPPVAQPPVVQAPTAPTLPTQPQVPPVADPSSGAPAATRGSATAGLYNNAQGSPLEAVLAGATSTLDIEIYDMDDMNVRQAIRAALRRNVKVRIVKEPDPLSACAVFQGQGQEQMFSYFGGPSTESSDCQDQRALVNEVISAGGQYVPFNKKALCGGGGTDCFEHGKIVIADGQLALVSTGNFNATNLCDASLRPKTCDRDYTVVTQDPEVIAALSQIVTQDLTGTSYDLAPILTSDVAAKLTVSPLSMDPLVAFIQSAQTKIQIQNQYLKDPTLNAAIAAAARAGRQVEVMVASPCAFGAPRPTDVRQFTAIFSQFENSGVSSAIFNERMKINGTPGYLHAKAIVVDGTRAWVGSVNGSTESLTRNREFGLFVDDPNEVSRLSGWMESDQTDPNAETWSASLQAPECQKAPN